MTQTADENVKNWNFPKLHMTTHIFDDIKAKGATRNYNTKPNEQMHGPLKDWYLNRTNFKNVAEQVSINDIRDSLLLIILCYTIYIIRSFALTTGYL